MVFGLVSTNFRLSFPSVKRKYDFMNLKIQKRNPAVSYIVDLLTNEALLPGDIGEHDPSYRRGRSQRQWGLQGVS